MDARVVAAALCMETYLRMLRFYIFGSTTTERGRKLNAAYAFCVGDRPDRIYWARGTNTDTLAAFREAGSRILDAVPMAGSAQQIQFITTAANLTARVTFALDRAAELKHGQLSPEGSEEALWLRFAQQFRTIDVKVGKPTLHGNPSIFRSVRRVAQTKRNMPDRLNPNPGFTERDDFDLVSDLESLRHMSVPSDVA